MVAEWARLWTVRSSWGLMVAAVVMNVGIGMMAGLGVDKQSEQVAEAWAASTTAVMPVQMVLFALAVTTVTADYSSGGIVPTLQWTPRRRLLYASRAAVVVLTVTAFAMVTGVLPAIAAYLMAPTHLTLSAAAGAQALGTVTGVVAGGAALSVGLGFLLRSTAGALVTTFLLVLVLPLFLLNSGNPVLATAAEYIPGSGAAYLLVGGGGPGMSDAQAWAVLAAWAVGSLAAGLFRFVRGDANR